MGNFYLHIVWDINALGGVRASRFHPLNTYLLVTYRVDMTCLFPEHLLQFLGDFEVNGKTSLGEMDQA